MLAFRVIFVATVVAASWAQEVSTTTDFNQGEAATYTTSSSPSQDNVFSDAAPATFSQAGQAISRNVEIVNRAPAAPKVHTIHTTSGRQHIRVEEFQSGPQIIRVHEQPARAPEVIRVQAPAEQQSVIRVINKNSGAPHVERVVHQNNEPHIINIQRPAPPPARIIQVVRSPAPAPRVIFQYEGQNEHTVHVDSTPQVHVDSTPQVHVPAVEAINPRVHAPTPVFTSAQPSFTSSRISATPFVSSASQSQGSSSVSTSSGHRVFGNTVVIAKK